MERKLAIEAEHEQIAKAISIDTAKEGLSNLLNKIERAKEMLLNKKRVNTDNRALLLRRLDRFETRVRSAHGYYELSDSQLTVGSPLKAAKDLVEELEEELQNELLLGIKGYHSRGKKVPHPKYALEVKELLSSGLKHLDKEISSVEIGFEAPKATIEVTSEIDRIREALLEEELFPGLNDPEITPELPRVTAQDIEEIINTSSTAPILERRAVPRIGNAKATEPVDPKNFVIPLEGTRVDLRGRILSVAKSTRPWNTLVPDEASPTLVEKEEAVVPDDELSIFEDHEQDRGDGVFTASILDKVEIGIEDLGDIVAPTNESVEDEDTDIIAMESFEDSDTKNSGESATTSGPDKLPPHDDPTEDDVRLPDPDTETTPHARPQAFDDDATMVRHGGGGGDGPDEPSFFRKHWRKFATVGAIGAAGAIATGWYSYLKNLSDEYEARQNANKPVLTISDEEVSQDEVETPSENIAPGQDSPSILLQDPAPRPITIQDLLYSRPLPGAPDELIDTWEEVLAAQAEDEARAQRPISADWPILKVDKTVWDAVETRLSALNPNVSDIEIANETDNRLRDMDNLSDNEKLFGEKLRDGGFYEHVKTELLNAGGYEGVFEMVEGEAVSVNGFLNAPEISGNPALYGKMQRQFAAFLLTQSEIDKLME